jgi:hypothetical protein
MNTTPWESPVKKRLREGWPVIGASITVNSVDVAAQMATLGFDFLWIDVSGGGGGNHFGGLESATPRMLGGGEWRHGGVWGESAFRPSGGDF